MVYELVSQYAEEYSEGRVSDDIFKRTFDKPLWRYCIDIFESLTMLPGLTLDSWELVEDQSKINVELDRKIIKDKRILNNDSIRRVVPIDHTDEDLLRATFSYTVKGKRYFTDTVEMFIPHQDQWGYYHINGRTLMPLNQVVDRSTFVKDNTLIFKTIRWPIKITAEKRIISTSAGPIQGNGFFIDIFMKKFQPLLYYLAHFGLEKTIDYFYMANIVGITSKRWDLENYVYLELPCKDGKMYLSLDKKYLKVHFAVDFFITLSECLIEEKSLGEPKEVKKGRTPGPLLYSNISDIEYWKGRLAYQIYMRDAKNARSILLSFKRALDTTTKNTTSGIKKIHLRDTFTLVRYLLTDYYDLIKKDNHDMKNKRVRNNECLAHYLDSYLTQNMNSLLGDTKVSPGRVRTLLRSINHGTMYKALSAYDLWRYERYNDYDAINLARYTLAGPAGINGGKYKTAMADRVIYPSQIGIYDISTSTSNPGITGFFCINVKLHELGAFSDKMDSNRFIEKVTAIQPVNSNMLRMTEDLFKVMNSRLPDGRFSFDMRKTFEELWADFYATAQEKGFIITQEGRIALLPKEMYGKDGRLKFLLKEDSDPEDADVSDAYEYDASGRIKFVFKRSMEEIHQTYMRRRAKIRRKRKDEAEDIDLDE